MRNCARSAIVSALLACAASTAGTPADARTTRLAEDAAAAARAAYTAITTREALLRRELDAQPGAPSPVLRTRMRVVVADYFRAAESDTSPFSDDALWQGATLAADTFWAFGEDDDRRTALRAYAQLGARFPASAFARQAQPAVARLSRAISAGRPPIPPTTASRPVAPGQPSPQAPAVDGRVALTTLRREVLPEAVRIVLELDRETVFRDERLEAPSRVFVDLKHTRAIDALKDATLSFPDEVVRQVRIGRPDGDTTRVVFDLQNAGHYSVYPLYQPYRLVVDFERPSRPVRPAGPAQRAPRAPTPGRGPVESLRATPAATAAPLTPRQVRGTSTVPLAGPAAIVPTRAMPGASWSPEPLPSGSIHAGRAPLLIVAPLPSGVRPGAPQATVAVVPVPVPAPVAKLAAAGTVPPAGPTPVPAVPPPAAPAANLRGGFSLSRQLGLGVSRVVIDPGHGGHDPGARVKGLNEADVVLDIALRLEKLLQGRDIPVVLTRRANVYVPLEQRTAIANREEADLFLSIHANASDNPRARGIETYFLNFAANPDAERVAARENASAGRTMHSLPDIVKAIALNNKINESRDFASYVQASMVDRMKKLSREPRDLGVKQAPFMVLIGATMPSVLAEVSFITNKDEGSLMKTPAFRQQVAESLLAGIQRYQRALKANPTQTVAVQE